MSEDMRKLIKNAFISLYETGGIKAVSVQKLCDSIPVSRTTFYANYPDIYSVLEEIQDGIIADLFKINKNFPDYDLKLLKNEVSINELKETLDYIKKNSKYFKALLGEYCDGQFVYKWKKIIKFHFEKKYRKEYPNFKYFDLMLEQISSSVIGAYTYWIFNNYDIPLNDFAQICLPHICFELIKL